MGSEMCIRDSYHPMSRALGRMKRKFVEDNKKKQEISARKRLHFNDEDSESDNEVTINT